MKWNLSNLRTPIPSEYWQPISCEIFVQFLYIKYQLYKL